MQSHSLVSRFCVALVRVRDEGATVTVEGITISPPLQPSGRAPARFPRIIYDNTFWDGEVKSSCLDGRSYGSVALNTSRSGVRAEAVRLACEVEDRERVFAECVASLRPLWERWEREIAAEAAA